MKSEMKLCVKPCCRLLAKAAIIILTVLLSAVTICYSANNGVLGVSYAANNALMTEIGSSAASMAVLDDDGNLIYSKCADTKREMASTTKICTAITVLDNCIALNRKIIIPDSAVGVEGSSIYLERGEQMTIMDLLYGLMLRSGNDCAVALAIAVGSSVEGFAKLMNETAIRAGALNSNFVNPHGLHAEGHYTTAKDLALITYYAMKNPVFKTIVSTKTHTTRYANHDYNRVMYNKNKILNTYEGGDGVKTGFTKAAGRCLVSSATRDGKQVIAVVLNCSNMFEECERLMDLAFA